MATIAFGASYGVQMRGWSSALGLVCGWTGAALWAIGVTVLQPMTEPADWAENNTYWVRDVRWMAIFAVFATLILLVRGDRIRSGLAALGVACWLGVDLWLDRIDVAGSNSTKWAAALGCLVVLAAFLVESLSPGRPDHRVLAAAAGVAAATVPMAVLIESPTDTEAALSRSALALGFLLTAVAVGGAVSAAASPTVRNVVLAIGSAIAAAGLVVLVRVVPIDVRILALFPLIAVLLTGVGQCAGPGRALLARWLAMDSSRWPYRSPT